MSIDVDPDWWKTMFDEVYLITDARSICDDGLTCREVDVICELLPLEFDHRILDLCGGHGRHTFELYKRGFTECTLLDYSQKLIDVAEAEAHANKFTVDFVRADARSTDLPDNFFDHVIIMGNSMGYIRTNEADVKILAESYRILSFGGWLLVDVTDGSVVKDSFCPNSWHEIGDRFVVCRNRELQEEIVKAREMVIDKQKGLIRDRTYAIRLYDSSSLELLFRQAGFNNVNIYTNFSPHQSSGDFGFMNNRMIGIGQKI